MTLPKINSLIEYYEFKRAGLILKTGQNFMQKNILLI